jgi:hypothetical protein
MVTKGMKRNLASVGVALVVLAILAGACGPPENAATLPGTLPTSHQIFPWGDLTVEQASEFIGLPVPVPEYLPAGYAISTVRIKKVTEPPGPYWNIEMTIASAGSSQPMSLSTSGFSMGMKMPPGVETVMVGASRAWVHRTADGASLSWIDSHGRQDSLQVGTDIQFDELVKIAQSVTSPPTKAVEITSAEDAPLLVLRGASQSLVFHFRNNSTKDVLVSFSLDKGISQIASGISVSIDRETFTLAPRKQADITAKIAVSTGAPSPTYDRPSASSILSADPASMPPPAGGGQTEQPSYYLSFQMLSCYSAADLSIRESQGFSRQLRIDPPPILPAGMVSLQEAQAAANFPVAMLLPAYFPEGTNPPPLGYAISEQEPHVITAFYSSFNIQLSPEPGVKEPPFGFAGQRDTIRKRQVVMGNNRIDWWADDIHRTVINNVLPMSELRLIAESMMLVGVYSGSWIGMK